jgi:hypothetical protein
MTRAFLAGLAILVIGDTAYFAALTLPEAPSEVAMVIWVVPVVAAFVTSWLAPKRKFYAGLVVVVPAALMIGASNFVFGAMGNGSDFPGLKGSVLVAGMSLPFLGLLCAVGALAGHFLFNRRANA